MFWLFGFGRFVSLVFALIMVYLPSLSLCKLLGLGYRLA